MTAPEHACILTGLDGENPDDCTTHDHEPLPAACMDGVCACPSAPDGTPQHLDEQIDAGLLDDPRSPARKEQQP